MQHRLAHSIVDDLVHSIGYKILWSLALKTLILYCVDVLSVKRKTLDVENDGIWL